MLDIAIFKMILPMLVAGIIVFFVAPNVNEGGGGGGYTQLPQCGPPYWGQTLYVQNHFWYCARYSDHWVITG